MTAREPNFRRAGRPRGSRSRYTGPTPSQRALLDRLRAAGGEWVHIDWLCDTVYAGSSPPLGWLSVLRKHLCELRHRHGYPIANRYGGEYALLREGGS